MAAKKSCRSCGNAFIGRRGAEYCSPACRQRARRARGGANRDIAVTDTAPAATKRPRQKRAAGRQPRSSAGGHCAEAVALLRSFETEMAENSQDRGLVVEDALSWSAAERAILEMAMDATDRKVDLQDRYRRSDDDKLRTKLSAEIRLLEASVARLLKCVSTDLPEPQSKRSQKAQRAANVRWRGAD